MNIVLTGGPGSGKTSLACELQKHKFALMPESGRSILHTSDGMQLRDSDPHGYAMAMLERDLANIESTEAQEQDAVFDRGLPDIVGYLNLMGIKIPSPLNKACREKRYQGALFAAPPWAEIYENDTERTQGFDEACQTYTAVVEAWKAYDYEPIDLPKTSVVQRASFILDHVS